MKRLGRRSFLGMLATIGITRATLADKIVMEPKQARRLPPAFNPEPPRKPTDFWYVSRSGPIPIPRPENVEVFINGVKFPNWHDANAAAGYVRIYQAEDTIYELGYRYAYYRSMISQHDGEVSIRFIDEDARIAHLAEFGTRGLA